MEMVEIIAVGGTLWRVRRQVVEVFRLMKARSLIRHRCGFGQFQWMTCSCSAIHLGAGTMQKIGANNKDTNWRRFMTMRRIQLLLDWVAMSIAMCGSVGTDWTILRNGNGWMALNGGATPTGTRAMDGRNRIMQIKRCPPKNVCSYIREEPGMTSLAPRDIALSAKFQKTCSSSAIHVLTGMKPKTGAKTKDTN